MHTPCELLALEDVENAARLLAAFTRRVPRESDFTP
jgi:endoglucanase